MNQEEHVHKWAVLRQNTYCLKKSEFIYQSRGIFAPATASLRLCKKRGVSQFGNPQSLPSLHCVSLSPVAEASEKGSILEKLVLFMPKNVKKTH